MEHNKKKLGLISVFLTFFLDNLCWAIVFPIFAPYFLDVDNRLFSPEVTVATRTALLGIFLAAFPLGQFLGSPLLGEYADRNGRRHALLLSLFFTLAGLVLSAASMQFAWLWLLLVGRLITGIFSGNLSICLACIADLSSDAKSRARYFGYLSVTVGVSFIAGAFFGGKLSDPTLHPLFTPSFPFWLAALLAACNLLFLFLVFPETTVIDPKTPFSFLEGIKNIRAALKTEQIKRIYAIYFLFLFAWTLIMQFTPVLVVERFQFTNSSIANLAGFMGICWALGSGYFSKLFLKNFSDIRILQFCFPWFALLCAFLAFPSHLYWTLLILGFCVLIGGTSWPLCASVISNAAPSHLHGKIFGMSQSMQSLAMTLAPIIGGLAYRGFKELPFMLAGGATLLAGVIYCLGQRAKHSH